MAVLKVVWEDAEEKDDKKSYCLKRIWELCLGVAICKWEPDKYKDCLRAQVSDVVTAIIAYKFLFGDELEMKFEYYPDKLKLRNLTENKVIYSITRKEVINND